MNPDTNEPQAFTSAIQNRISVLLARVAALETALVYLPSEQALRARLLGFRILHLIACSLAIVTTMARLMGLIDISVTAVVSCFLLTTVCVLFLVIAKSRQARDRQLALTYTLEVTNSQLTRLRENEPVSERELWGNDLAALDALDPSNTNKSASDTVLIIVCGVGVLLLPVIGLFVIFGNSVN